MKAYHWRRRRRTLARVLTVAVLASVAACEGPPTYISPLTDLKVTGPASVGPGTTATYSASLYDINGKTTDVTSLATWTSSDPAILQMNPGGVAVAKSRGEANVIATYRETLGWFPVSILEAGTFKIFGSVTEPQAGFGQGIKGATIEVVRGTGLGIRTTTTDHSGRYELYGVAGDVQLKVAADGYETRLVNLNISRSGHQLIALIPQEGPPGSLSGRWILTVLAPDCEFLPGAARSRQFFADISHTGSPRLAVKLSSSRGRFPEGLIIGQIIGSEIALALPYWPGDVVDGPYYALMDWLEPKGFLGFRGHVRATVDGSVMNGALEGTIDYYPDKLIGDTAMTCVGPASVTLKREGQ